MDLVRSCSDLVRTLFGPRSEVFGPCSEVFKYCSEVLGSVQPADRWSFPTRIKQAATSYPVEEADSVLTLGPHSTASFLGLSYRLTQFT